MAYDMVQEGLISADEGLLRLDANRLEQLFKPVITGSRQGVEAKPATQGPERLAGGGRGTGGVHRRRRRGVGRAGRAGDPGAAGDDPRRLPRHDPLAGHPDQRRRDELARRGRGPRRGHPGRVRRGRRSASSGAPAAFAVGGTDASKRATGSPSTAPTARSTSSGSSWTEPAAGQGRAGRHGGARGQDLEGVRGVHGPRRRGAAPARSGPTRTRRTRPRTPGPAAREGIGLCRTEHMFLGEERVAAVRQMIFADTPEEERRGLRRPSSRCSGATSSGSSRPWTGCPSPSGCSTRRCTSSSRTTSTSRWPWRWPRSRGRRRRSSSATRSWPLDEAQEILGKVEELHEANPMLGLRGVRLGIVKPGLYAMQVRAIVEAACDRRGGRRGPQVARS